MEKENAAKRVACTLSKVFIASLGYHMWEEVAKKKITQQLKNDIATKSLIVRISSKASLFIVGDVEERFPTPLSPLSLFPYLCICVCMEIWEEMLAGGIF